MQHSPSHNSSLSGAHRWAFLINPVSGNGSGRVIHQKIMEALPRLGLSEDRWVCKFTLPGHQLVEQVKVLSREFDRVIVAGGDGTIGLAIQGIVHGHDPTCALGVIPLGTGNDLARELRLLDAYHKGGLDALLKAFLLDQTAPLDLWSINGSATMVNYLSMGLDGKATEAFAHRRHLGGDRSVLANKFRFAQAGFLSIFHRLPSDFSIRIHNGGSFHDVALPRRRTLAVFNISHYAAGMIRMAGTRPDDARLTVACIPSIISYGGLFLRRIFTRGRIGSGMLPVWKADRLECFWTGDVGLQIDGEGRDDLRECGHLDIAPACRIQVLIGSPEAES